MNTSNNQLNAPVSGTAEALAAGAALADPRSPSELVGGNPFVVVPKDYKIQDISQLLNKPTRNFGSVEVRDSESFCRYVRENKTPATRVYGTTTPARFVAVFNDSLPDEPGWRDHTAVFNCALAREWSEWLARDGKAMEQVAFAQWIEQALPDLASPPAAEMLEISRSLEAKKKVNFASGVRLHNGENQLTYEESIEGTAAKGQLRVPEEFSIGIPVLENGPRYQINARLRYRIGEGGRLTMWFELIRPHVVLEDAINEVRKQIEQVTGIKPFNGTLPARS